ncbi:MAG: hypothetical protein J5742_02770 [Alphaproteobacteria bacterium]|nr:hypothetical protein [Alphaproteobacteria bacterium]
MNILTKYSGFLAVLCLVNVANAAGGLRTTTGNTSRISVATAPGTNTKTMTATQAAARRLPTMISTSSVVTTGTTSTTTASLLTKTECVEQYTECIKEADVCGFEFEECTTSELFYAKKPQCNNVLLQCAADGINALFGTNNTTNLATKNANGEYVYPTAGSILGQFIEAGHINNLYDTSTCVKRVTSCLKKENVCGEDFELCTTNKEFKKQKLFCESTLARCQEGGLTELFGSASSSANPTSASRLGVMISEGAELASVNAVSTCYKVADQCILSACTANPYRCIKDSSFALSTITDAVNEGKGLPPEQAEASSDVVTQKQVSGFIMNSCLDTIGGNKYCYATANDGKMPSAAQLMDPDNRDEVYANIYASRMNAGMMDKIQKMADKFDKKTKDKCSDTIMSCAMRSCGSGLGSMCYSLVFGQGRQMADFKGTINGDNSYQEIKNGCEAIVNTDANCQYAAATANANTYNYNYSDSGTFGTLFPLYSESESDPLGVVARLNAALADNYNDAAIAALAKQCKNTAVSCIKSMCGSDYTNCYRNRTDIMSDTYDTGNSAFDHSMNKVGGVLDFTIVTGLCMETVKSATACDEHLKIQSVRYMSDDGAEGWGKNSVRTAWVDAVKTGYKQATDANGNVKKYTETVLMGCTVGTSSTSETCKAKQGNVNMVEDCGYVDEDGCIYDTEYRITETDYAFNMSADTLFQEVLGDIEKEAQAKYNAKITKEQNMCIGANNGGLMGARDMSSTYMWVKLKSKRIPKNYSTAGLKVNDFVASNDLYGSFCRARVTIQSDDPNIQAVLQTKNQNWSTAYFAVGDVFTCGSWIPQEKLEEIAKRASGQVAGTELYERNEQQRVRDERNANWIAGLTAVAGAAGAGFLVNKLQDQNILGGLLNKNVNTNSSSRTNKSMANTCLSAAKQIETELSGEDGTTSMYDLKDKGMLVRNISLMEKAAAQIKDYNGKNEVTLDATSLSHCKANSEKLENNVANCLDQVMNLKMQCDRVIENNGEVEVKDSQDNTRRWVSIGAAAVGGAGTFFLVRKAIRDSKETARTEEQQQAYDKFMREVGDHIYCFIGADEAGNYGDLIEISVE